MAKSYRNRRDIDIYVNEMCTPEMTAYKKAPHWQNGWYAYQKRPSAVLWNGIEFVHLYKYYGAWKADLFPPTSVKTPAELKQWEAEHEDTEKAGFMTRKEAAAWALKRSLEIGVLWEEKRWYLSPLEQLAECAE